MSQPQKWGWQWFPGRCSTGAKNWPKSLSSQTKHLTSCNNVEWNLKFWRLNFYKSNSEHNFATGWPMWVQLWLRQLLAKAGVPEIIRQNMSSNHCPHTIHSTTHLSTSFPRALWHPIHSMISTACGKNQQVPGSKRWSSPPLIGNSYNG